MRRIRIKKDITCVWRVTTNGQATALAGRDLSLLLVDPKFKKTTLTFTTSGNALNFRVGHDLQTFTGIYRLELWENIGTTQQSVVDRLSAFELVSNTTQESDGSADDIAAATADLGTASLAVGVKGDTGATGAQGERGADGSDANVTEENIILALGYTPADEAELEDFQTELTALEAIAERRTSANYCEVLVDTSNRILEGHTADGTKRIFTEVELKNVPLKPSVLTGKKWAVVGDSFTNGATTDTISGGKYNGSRAVYPYFIGNRTGAEVLKFFEGGRTLAYPTDGSFTNSFTCPTAACYYQNIPEDVDYITIYLGINDEHHAGTGTDGEDTSGAITLGTIDDATTATYFGAWNVVLQWLIQNRPFAHIGIIVSNGITNAAWVYAQIAIAKKYGLPYLNLNGDENTPAMIRCNNVNIPTSVKNMLKAKQAVDPDGSTTGSVNTHPNTNAHKYESFFIQKFVESL